MICGEINFLKPWEEVGSDFNNNFRDLMLNYRVNKIQQL